MKKTALFLLFIFIVSCKPKAIIAQEEANKTLSSTRIIENHYNNKIDFSTLYIKAGARYQDENQAQNVQAEIKIKKNEKILISVRILGYTVAKALITPTSVQYYEKIGSKFFEGDYSVLSQWLGTDLDYQKVQNMFIGKALDDLNKDNYTVSILDNIYKLGLVMKDSTSKAYFFENDKFLIKRQEISQSQFDRAVQIVYPEYKKFEEMTLPTAIEIAARQKQAITNITIDYKNVSFNEELSFPYSVPEGYEKIYIEKK